MARLTDERHLITNEALRDIVDDKVRNQFFISYAFPRMAAELLAFRAYGLSPAEVADLLAIGNEGGKKVMAAEKEANALRAERDSLAAKLAEAMEVARELIGAGCFFESEERVCKDCGLCNKLRGLAGEVEK